MRRHISRKNWFFYVAFLSAFVLFSHGAGAQPFLAFSDLISGPSSGLGDGRGSGVVVTVWGQNLGSSQGESEIFFRSSDGETTQVAHVYYWKNADGKLPSGPANLFESHGMQEVAFSIPQASDGLGEIVFQVDGVASNVLPFRVRSGNIYHVKRGGDDSNEGTWSSPFASAAHAVNAVPAGSTIYVHDVDTGSFSNPTARAIYWNNSEATSTLQSQFSLLAYPGFQPKAIAQKAIESFRTEGWVVSKFDVYASNYLSVDSNGQPVGEVISTTPRSTYGIQTSRNGRVVANRIGDIPGGCASAWDGAIVGNKSWVGNNKIYGNEIYDYGCAGSDKLHHTTYMSIRSKDDPQLEPWEWAYNYLHGNKAKFGIHNYDEGDVCGDLTGPLLIYSNVIKDQGGAGISIGSACGWSMDVYIENNILINVGLAAAWNGIDPSTSAGAENGGIAIRDANLTGDFFIRNNLIYVWSPDEQGDGGEGCLTFNSSGDNVDVLWSKNICYTEVAVPFVGAGFRADNKLDNVRGSNNIWYAAGSSASYLTAPDWDREAIEKDPLIRISGPRVVVDPSSPAFGGSVGGSNQDVAQTFMSSGQLVAAGSESTLRDIYGNLRSSLGAHIGPISLQIAAPNPPSGLKFPD